MPPVNTKKVSSENEDSNGSAENLEPRRKKKRGSRWEGTESDRAFIPGMPTTIPTNMSKDQEKAYLTQLRIEQISRMLRTGELGISSNPEERSPSPEPIYDSQGKRLNTREVRQRNKLESERHKYVLEMFKLNAEYKPPPDYKPPANKIVDKVFIPQEEHPEINFVGLLIGPRGNTLKMLEKDTNAKIIIRGKGSVKEGKLGRINGQPLPGEDEPLHAYITGPTAEIVAKACEKVREIVQQGIDVPETMNDLRKSQLRELALLNGTLRENDGLNKLKLIETTKTIVTNTIICSLCGGAGHITGDCKLKTNPELAGTEKPVTWAEREKMDNEYQSLMAELGQGPAPDMNKPGRCIISRNGTTGSSASLALEAPSSSSEFSNSPKVEPPSDDANKHPPPPPYAMPGYDPAADPNYYAQYYAYMWPGASGYGWPPMTSGAPPPPPPPPPPPN